MYESKHLLVYMYTTNTHMLLKFHKRTAEQIEGHILSSWISSVQFSSVAQSCPTLCDPMNHSTAGLPVHHQLPEFTQTHVR